MKTTSEQIFANSMQMMLWQEKNCCRCTKAISTSKATVYRCALQRDIECQQDGRHINERSYKLIKGVDACPLIKLKDSKTQMLDAHEFAKGKPIEQPKPSSKVVTRTFSAEEIKAAEKKVLDNIWEKDIAPNLNNAIKTMRPMSEASFKTIVRRDTQTMLNTFTWEENMMIAFVPISEFKKLGRSIKELRQKYIDVLRLDLDYSHINRIETQTLQFMDECNYDLAILWYQVNQYIKTNAPDMPYDTMRTDAAVAVMMVRYLKAHNRRMDAIIAAKMRQSNSIDNPQMRSLEKLMMQYFPNDFKLETNTNLDLCGKIFAKNLSKIEFEVV